MKTSSIKLIEPFLASKPNGATGREIADFIGVNPKITGQMLGRLQERSHVVRMTANRSREEATWRSAHVAVEYLTPPVFHAMEILAAMQAASMDRLLKRRVA